MKRGFTLLACTSLALAATTAFANHKKFHIECKGGATATAAVDALHTVMHTMSDGTYTLGDHGKVHVVSLSALTVTQTDDSFSACTVVTFRRARPERERDENETKK